AGMVADQRCPVMELPLLNDQEWEQVVVEWNATTGAYRAEQCVHEIFEQQVELIPEAVAVSYADQHLSYKEFNTRANQLARALTGLGVGADVLVGIFTDRGPEALVGVLGA